jgi:hypothetical protein
MTGSPSIRLSTSNQAAQRRSLSGSDAAIDGYRDNKTNEKNVCSPLTFGIRKMYGDC